MSDLPFLQKAALKALADKNFAEFSCLLSLLGEHPVVINDSVLKGAVSTLQSQFVALWDEVERNTE